MAISVFDRPGTEPTEDALLETLRQTANLWQELQSFLQQSIPEIRLEWKYYGPKSGWLLKTYSNNRNLFFTNPQEGYCRLVFVFGEQAFQAIMATG